jgi:hypothetical protein
MRTLVAVCTLVVVAGAYAVEPDPVALELAEENDWGPLPNAPSSALEFLIREKLTDEARLLSDSNFDSPVGAGDALLLRKRLEMPGLDPTGQGVEQFSMVQRLRLDTGELSAMRRMLNNEIIDQRRASFGADSKVLGAGLILGAQAMAGMGAMIDQEIAASGFGGIPLFDGMLGAAMTGSMLGTGPLEDSGMFGEITCEMLESDAIDYSETFAIGVSPLTNRFSISTFLAGPACFLRIIGERFYVGAAAQDGSDAGIDGLLAYMAAMGQNFGDSLVFRGFEGSADDKVAVVGITGLNIQEDLPDGGTLTIHEMNRSIDADAYVPAAMTMVGTMQKGGQQKEITWEATWSDYRNIAGTALYEPHHQTAGVSNMLSDAERAQMAEAEQQLAEFEKQLASMPADQREMMERMVGPQIAQYRSMASGGGTSFEMITQKFDANPDLLDPDNNLGAMAGEDREDLIVKQVQKDLAALGYDPGPMNGKLTPETVNAIRAFERDNGMPETGQATMELINVLTIQVLAAG